MEELQAPADPAGLTDIADAPVEATEAESVDQVDKPEGEETEEDRRKRENRERREREKTYKQRLREERDAAEAKVQEAEARKRKIVEAGQRQAQPVESEFQDYTEFQMAKALWKAKQAEREEAASEAGSEAEEARKKAETIKAQEQQIAHDHWVEQVAEAKTRYADFEAVALDKRVPITPLMAELIQSSDIGTDVAYHLGKNRAIAAQIANMPPLEAARAMGRIEASITAPKARTETQAPDPITPVKGKASPTKSVDAMSMEEYRAARMAGKLR